MYSTIIFDLSEVLILGLTGVEYELSERLGIHKDKILDEIYSPIIFEFFRGKTTEQFFIEHIINSNNWNNISPDELRILFRENFTKRISGMDTIVKKLHKSYELVLLSDHSKEWIDFIKIRHPFLADFDFQFFSFELGHIKQEQITFSLILDKIGKKSNECIFIDDLASNIAIAQSLGIKGICFENSNQLVKELNGLGIFLD